MTEQPSYRTSTLSQLAVGTLLVFSAAAFMVGSGVIWFKLPVELSEKVMSPFAMLLGMVLPAYLTARRTGNGPPSGGAPA